MSPEQERNKTLEEWAGSKHLSLALVFTDIVDSTKIGVKLGDNDWIDDLFSHFSQARQIAGLAGDKWLHCEGHRGFFDDGFPDLQ